MTAGGPGTLRCAASLGWLLSQFLHGEQGALLVACQVSNCIESLDGKLYGSTQIVDEGRHVEVSPLPDREALRDQRNLYVIRP